MTCLPFCGMDLWLFREIFIFIYEPKEIPLVMCYFLLFSLYFPYVLLYKCCLYLHIYFDAIHKLSLTCTLFHFKVPFLVFFKIIGLNSALSDETATSFFDQDFSCIHLFKITITLPLSNNLDSFKYILSIMCQTLG